MVQFHDIVLILQYKYFLLDELLADEIRKQKNGPKPVKKSFCLKK